MPRSVLASFGAAGRILRSGLISAGVLLVLGLALTPLYAVNDDAQMSDLVTGRTTGEPEPRIAVMSGLLTVPLAWAGSAFPSVPFYPLLLVVVQWLGLWALLHAFLSVPRRALRWLALGVVLALFTMLHLLRLSFTSTSMAAGIAGALLLLHHLWTGSRSRRALAAAALLVGLGYLLRPSSFMAQAAWLAPLALSVASLRQVKALAAVGLTVLAIVLVSQAVDRRLYRGEGWERWHRLNDLYVNLLDTSRLSDPEALRPVLAEVGWSAEDLRLFRSFFFAEPTFRDEVVLRRIADFADRLPRRYGAVREHLRSLLWNYRLCVAAVLAAWIACWFSMTGRSRLAGAVFLALLAGAVVYLAVFRKTPERVLTPLLFAAAAFPLFAPETPPGRRPRLPGARLGVAGAFAALVVAGLYVLRLAYDIDAENRGRVAALRAAEAEIAGAGVVHCVFRGFPYEHSPPFAPGSRSPGIRRVPLSWLWLTPPVEAAMERQGLADIGTALATRSDVRLVSTRGAAAVFEAYLRARRGFDVRLVPARALSSMPEVSVHEARPAGGR